MSVRILSLGLCLLLLVGCKRGTKDTGPAREVANPKVAQPAPAPDRKAGSEGKQDEPNWLKDERIQPKKDQLPADGSVGGGKTPWGVGAPAGGFQQPAAPGAQPNPAPGVLPAPVAQPPAPGATPPALPAARVTEADMKEVWVFVENASAGGRMPPPATTYAALIAAKSPAAALVKDGAIILTTATARESVWAYEARAYLSGGLVVTNNGVETMTAAELKRRLGK